MGTWTEERVAVLERLWDEGMATERIAERLGVTKNAVVGKAHRLGLKTRGNPITSSRLVGARKRAEAVERSRARAKLLPEVRRTIVAPGDIKAGECQWPIGEPGAPDFGFCGAEILEGGHAPYCEAHHGMAYRGAPRAHATGEAA